MFITLLAFIGICIGSFLNVVIYRLPIAIDYDWKSSLVDEMEEISSGWSSDKAATAAAETVRAKLRAEIPYKISLSLPGSHCPNCKRKIRPWDNIPLLSYVLLRGRCRACHAQISWTYPATELCILLLAVANWFTWQDPVLALGGLAFCAQLFAIAAIDYRVKLIPRNLSQALLWTGVFFTLMMQPISIGQSFGGILMGFCAITSVNLVMAKAGWQSMGNGDTNLAAALGAWLGWHYLPFVLLLGCVLTLPIAIKRKDMTGNHRRVPFGPGLTIAGGLAWFALARGIPLNIF